MASGAIKGITIKLGADASELVNSLNKADQSLKDTQKQLNEVNKALKFNPNNVDLLKQKATLLEQKIKDNTQSIKDMKTALKQMDDQGIDKTSKEYMDLERAIIEAESKQKTFNKQLRDVKALSTPIAQLGTKFQEVGKKIEGVGQSLREVSMAAAAVTTAITAMTYKAARTADDINTLSKQYGLATKDIQLYAQASELVDVSVGTISKSVAKMKKSMLSASQGSKNTQEAFDKLGISIQNSDGSLRDQNDVFQEAIEKLGQMKNETERDAYAMTIFGKSAAMLNPLIEDSGKTYKKVADTFKRNNIDIVDQKTLDQANRFNDAVDTMKATASQAFFVIGNKLAADLAPALENIAEAIAEIAGKIANMNPKLLEIVAALGAILAATAPLLIAIGRISTGIGALMQWLPKISMGLSGVLNPIGLVTAGIVAATGAIFYAIKAKTQDAVAENELYKAYQANAQARKQAIADSLTQSAVASEYAAKIEELQKKERLSNAEKEKMRLYVEALNEATGKQTATINEQTGKLNESIGIIKQRIEALKEEAKAEAYASNFKSAIAEQVEIEKKLTDAVKERNKYYTEMQKGGVDAAEIGKLDQLDTKVKALAKSYDEAGAEADDWANKMTGGNQKAAKSSSTASSQIIKAAGGIKQAGKDAGEGYNTNLGKGMSKAKTTASKGAKQAVKGADAEKGKMKTAGKGMGGNLVSGLWNGITDKVGWLITKIKSFASNVKSALKSFFGIKSPSKWAKDMIGKNIVLGMAKGITDNTRYVEKAMNNLVPSPRQINAVSNAGAVMQNAQQTPVYSFGNITLDVKELKDVLTVEQFANVMIKAKAFG